MIGRVPIERKYKKNSEFLWTDNLLLISMRMLPQLEIGIKVLCMDFHYVTGIDYAGVNFRKLLYGDLGAMRVLTSP